MRTVRVPGDKSLTHRALLLAGLADGRSRIRGSLDGADTQSTAAALRLLGCAVPPLDSAELCIEGRGLRGLAAPAAAIDCGNSGTTARLLLGVLAACPFDATLTGDESLCSRPMRRVTVPLSLMGAGFAEIGAADRLPIRVRGAALRGLDYESPQASAQVKSALLLAGLVAGVAVSVTEPSLSRDHTERLLARLGVRLERDVEAGAYARVALTPAQRLDPLDFDVPGDFSSAAFVIAHATLAAAQPVRIAGVGLNPGRTGFLDVLRRMGGSFLLEDVREACGEPVGDVVVERAPLSATRVVASEIPALIDEVPVIAALAARAEGTTVIEGAGELRVKESDRIRAVVANLRAVGVAAEELPDGLVVHGTTRTLAGTVRTLHDHRIGMAFGVLAAAQGGGVEIDDPRVVAVSFPGFWPMLQTLSAP
jgi:3-phosphoshikimate 1-carboxyvinyltransferase